MSTPREPQPGGATSTHEAMRNSPAPDLSFQANEPDSFFHCSAEEITQDKLEARLAEIKDEIDRLFNEMYTERDQAEAKIQPPKLCNAKFQSKQQQRDCPDQDDTIKSAMNSIEPEEKDTILAKQIRMLDREFHCWESIHYMLVDIRCEEADTEYRRREIYEDLQRLDLSIYYLDRVRESYKNQGQEQD
ncbi:unnamed protein product [Penicillium pancosmium]